MRNRVLWIGAVVLAAALVALSASPAWAQATNTGTILGSVYDNSGAFVPGAAVAITQTTTGATRTTTTDKSGRFVFADVDPGTYVVKVSKQGFTTEEVANQVVQIGTQLNENIELAVGAITTTVEVTETPGAELQTSNATVGTTLSGDIVINLPNTGRDASSLAVLQPGQNINGNVGGVASDQNSFQLDGGYATDDMSGDNNTYIASFASDTSGGIGNYHSSGYNQVPSAVIPVPVASIEEFKISTANQTADFSGGAGSQMQLVTKRGTNSFHGGVYEYYLDNNFAGANTWDNKFFGEAQPSAHFSRFGGDAGGKIPGVNVLGGGWYLFGLYEGFRFPQNSEYEQDFPTPSLRAGLIHEGTATYNINPYAVVDPGCGAAGAKGCLVTTTGQTIPGSTLDPLGYGLNPAICKPGTSVGSCSAGLWSYLPLPNDCTSGDGLNYCGYRGPISTPQTSNFGVTRMDHDFGSKWHFNGTYHYYHLIKTVADQWDIGGFFPGDTEGTYSAIRHKPQVPWLMTAGLTTELTSNMTNNVRVSYTRNYWAYEDPSGVPNVAGYPAALEIGGEQSDVFGPYDTYNQGTRTRFWDGRDIMIGDDVSWLKGNHVVQLGGSVLRNNDTHNRNDNGESINTYEQYIIGSGSNYAANNGSYNLDFSAYTPAGISNALQYQNFYSMILGIVDETQALYTRGLGTLFSGLPLNPRASCAIPSIAATSGCVSSPSLTDDSILPTYSLYATDSWHLKPTFSLNYGLGYSIEMPPYSVNGGYQTVMVNQNNQILSTPQYLSDEEQAALQGQAYAPLLGFTAIRNVPGHSHYPYDPFFLGLSPRIGMAWNFKPDTVIRAGYARIFGRINGVNPILVPMLTPGLMQPDVCGGPNTAGGCGTGSNPTTPVNAFRVGVDGVNAPLPPPVASLPQPWYPGFNSTATGAGETFDPNFKPNRNDEFTLSIQHQFGPKLMLEAGYIGRKLNNEIQYYSLTNVPYMMTLGGQSFANAWKNIMVATNYGYRNLPNVTANTSSVPAQPFFETAIGLKPGAFAPNGYCYNATAGAPYPNCTAAFIANNDVNGSFLMPLSDAFDAWGGVSNAGNFNFGRSFTSDPIPATCSATITIGCAGQSPSIVSTVSNGYGNYNAAYLQFTFQDWHGLTMKSDFTYEKALGTGDVVQASSSYATVDPFNLQNNYGPQYYNEKFAFNLFINYDLPFYKSQQGALGRIVGGWTISPLFVAGSGFPVQTTDINGDCGSFGECNTAYIFSYENMIFPTKGYSSAAHHATGTVCGTAGRGYNVYSNPDATCFLQAADAGVTDGGTFDDPVRNPLLGLDTHDGSGGPVYGLPFFNLDLGITKKIKINERFNSGLYFDWTNVLNHMQPADPCFQGYNPSTWGVLGCGGNLQANNPRQLQMGLTLNW
jgi:Carboxypeptidase regulatory-like domain/TonB dependent receptor